MHDSQRETVIFSLLSHSIESNLTWSLWDYDVHFHSWWKWANLFNSGQKLICPTFENNNQICSRDTPQGLATVTMPLFVFYRLSPNLPKHNGFKLQLLTKKTIQSAIPKLPLGNLQRIVAPIVSWCYSAHFFLLALHITYATEAGDNTV